MDKKEGIKGKQLMNYNYVLNNYSIDNNKLKQNGFKVKDDCFYLAKPIQNGEFIAKIKISTREFNVDLFDVNFGENYDLFNVSGVQGAFIENLKSQVDEIINDIKLKCFININVKDNVIDYILKKYKITPEHPWEDYPNDFTFKTKTKQKWFALIMDVPADKFGFNQKNMLDVINLKHNPENIANIIDNKNIFMAYHMNKKHWISVILNKNISMEKIENLIDTSYNLVEK